LPTGTGRGTGAGTGTDGKDPAGALMSYLREVQGKADLRTQLIGLVQGLAGVTTVLAMDVAPRTGGDISDARQDYRRSLSQ
jgi:hypothetical protein